MVGQIILVTVLIVVAGEMEGRRDTGCGLYCKRRDGFPADNFYHASCNVARQESVVFGTVDPRYLKFVPLHVFVFHVCSFWVY